MFAVAKASAGLQIALKIFGTFLVQAGWWIFLSGFLGGLMVGGIAVAIGYSLGKHFVIGLIFL
jgi:hypothetical protein